MRRNPKTFLSYSHSDRDFADTLARDLRESGIDVWLDKWEIQAGDSLIQKIFSEGLAESDYFLVVLSAASANSTWVREELDAAMVKKIEGVTRIIPVIKEQCDVPLPLRSLLWVDLSRDYDEGIRALVMAMHEVSERPPVGEAPEYVTTLRQSVGGLTKIASTIGGLLLSRPADETGFEKSYSAGDLNALIPDLSPLELNDAVDELESYGLVTTLKTLGTAPYDFYQATPTYALFLHFKHEGLEYDPDEDIKTVAAAVAAEGELDGGGLRRIVDLPPVRINRAVSYLEDYGYVAVLRFLGTAPYDFGVVKATRQTRQFVQERCR